MRKILIFIDWFKPAYKAGGPIRSVANIIDHLSGEFEFHIVTSDRDLGDQSLFDDVAINQWISEDKYRIIYLDQKHQSVQFYKRIFKEGGYDKVYLNSMFSLNFSIKPLIALNKQYKNVILAPRGMLGEGSLTIKPIRKKLFLILFKITGISTKVTWHATSPSEALGITHHFGEKVKIKTVRNLSSVMSDEPVAKPKKESELNLFFLSRISSIKNLKAALEFLSQIKKDIKICFEIIGPVEDEKYWDKCLQMISELPENIQVNYSGAVSHNQLNSELKDQHAMILPTHHENYGHVIIESWQNACPVIISDNTPWVDLESKKIGFDLSLQDPQKFVQAIEIMAEMNDIEFKAWSRSSHEYAKQITYDEKVIEVYRDLFSDAGSIV